MICEVMRKVRYFAEHAILPAYRFPRINAHEREEADGRVIAVLTREEQVKAFRKQLRLGDESMHLCHMLVSILLDFGGQTHPYFFRYFNHLSHLFIWSFPEARVRLD